ncbi:MAG TPA: hypothetical protein PLS03_16745 [Terrimicrobiaceae bacterium]|nr:hypothetical protein [Terrimicrobiaceae bacterium]
MFRIVYLAWLLTLASCASLPKGTPQWQRSDFLGKTFSLDHPTKIEQITFARQSRLAPVTFGQDDGKEIWVCAPLMYWRLRDGRLEVYDYDKTIYERFTLISRDEDLVTVTNLKGRKVTYKVK